MSTVLIRNAKIVNEGAIFEGDILIENEFIKEIAEKHGGDYKASSENGIYTTHTTLRNIEANI